MVVAIAIAIVSIGISAKTPRQGTKESTPCDAVQRSECDTTERKWRAPGSGWAVTTTMQTGQMDSHPRRTVPCPSDQRPVPSSENTGHNPPSCSVLLSSRRVFMVMFL